jgi:hypothetical protein
MPLFLSRLLVSTLRHRLANKSCNIFSARLKTAMIPSYTVTANKPALISFSQIQIELGPCLARRTDQTVALAVDIQFHILG